MVYSSSMPSEYVNNSNPNNFPFPQSHMRVDNNVSNPENSSHHLIRNQLNPNGSTGNNGLNNFSLPFQGNLY